MNTKNDIKFFTTVLLLSLFIGVISCEPNNDSVDTIQGPVLSKPDDNTDPDPDAKALKCNAQFEQTDYTIYRITDDGIRVGDVMPYFDEQSGTFYIYYLRDVWNDATHQRHPWYAFTTEDFSSFDNVAAGEIIASSNQGCEQDYAIGTGSVIKKDDVYYGFYTGHNPNYPSSCVTVKEGVMLATSTSPSSGFTKSTSFSTIYAPSGMQFDEQDNFRDPYLFEDSGTYYMLVSARANVSGTWRGVLASYKSLDLLSWTYDGIFYDGGTDNYFMLETAQVFNLGDTYYLIFSDIDSRRVNYRMSSSIQGPWSKPTGSEFLDGNDFYAAKAVSDGTNAYILGFTSQLEGNTDSGNRLWGGNMITHKLIQNDNNELELAIPDAVSAIFQTDVELEVNRTLGTVDKISTGLESYTLTSSSDISSVIYEPIDAARYSISTTISYEESSNDFGFFLGACDEGNNVISLRFVPGQNKIRLDKTNRSALTNSTVAFNEVEIDLEPNADYDVQVVIENSIVVIYVNNQVALTSRVYKASNTSWGVFADNSLVSFKTITVTKP